MKIRLEGGLPNCHAFDHHGRTDSRTGSRPTRHGSGGTLVSADRLLEVGVEAEPMDRIVSVRGVGGVEFVVRKEASEIRLGELVVRDAPVQIGSMNYGFQLDGIVGTDVLHAMGAVIDLGLLELRGPSVRSL